MKKKLGKDLGYSFMALEIHLRELYLKHMEAHFEEELKFIDKEYNNFKLKLENNNIETDWSEEAISFFEDSFYDDLFMIRDNFRKQFRDSQIIQLYSFIEGQLMKGCNRYASLNSTANKVSDLNGYNDIDRIKKYFKETIGISTSAFSEEWSFLDKLRLVRNQIVHHSGIIDNADPEYNKDKKFNKIKAFSANNFTLKLTVTNSNEYEIILDKKDFIPLIIKNTTSLFKKIAEYEAD
jgi:hypothetical protein